MAILGAFIIAVESAPSMTNGSAARKPNSASQPFATAMDFALHAIGMDRKAVMLVLKPHQNCCVE
jgi:hypothetical protein